MTLCGFFLGPGSSYRRGVKKSDSMKVTSLTGNTVITTELPRRSIDRTAVNGVVRAEKKADDDERPSTSGATTENAAKETVVHGVVGTVTKKTEKQDSAPVGVPPEIEENRWKKISVSGGLPNERASRIHSRSASLPANVSLPAVAKGKETHSVSSSPKTDKKATRNKSFAGMTKVSRTKKAPLDIFSLPETDVDSGITVACDRPASGRASKRNLRIMDLMKNSHIEEEKATKPGIPKARVQSKSESTSQKHSTRNTQDVRVLSNAPYEPDFLETELGRESAFQKNYFDAQRSFHVFIPNERNKLDIRKRFTYLEGISPSNERLLGVKDESLLKR